MKKKFLSMFFLFILTSAIFCDAEERYPFSLLEANLFTAQEFHQLDKGPLMALGIDYKVFNNRGAFWHAGAQFAFPVLLGPVIELGGAIVLKGESGYKDCFSIFTSIVGDYMVSTRTDDSAIYTSLHLLDFTLRTRLMWHMDSERDSEYVNYNWSYIYIDKKENYQDLYLMVGYRYLSVFDSLMPVQEYDLGIYAVAGLERGDVENTVERTYNDSISTETEGSYPMHPVYGAIVKGSWNIFNGEIGYIDDRLFWSIGLKISFSTF